jgi:hypothetical protein
LVSLSPLALAFIAGYGSDLFFVALDKIVQAFTSSSGAAGRTVTQVTSGGITTTSSQSSETRVASTKAATDQAITDLGAEIPKAA